jgi:pimeloyl-ACP methyl ester carboxylesterase
VNIVSTSFFLGEQAMQTLVSKDGTKIAYDVTGSGPALILVGGAFSYRRFPGFVKLAGLLAPDFTVVNYDRRGRGDSGDSAVYDVEREVEDLEAVIDAIGGSASVWGMSSGAALALEAAAAGLPIVKLALYEPPYVAGKQAAELPKDYEGQLRKLVEEGRRDDAVKLFMRNMGAPGFALAIMRLMPFWARLRASVRCPGDGRFHRSGRKVGLGFRADAGHRRTKKRGSAASGGFRNRGAAAERRTSISSRSKP